MINTETIEYINLLRKLNEQITEEERDEISDELYDLLSSGQVDEHYVWKCSIEGII